MDTNTAAAANVVSALGIEALPVDEQREVLDRVGGLLFGAVVSRTMEILSAGDRAALGELFAGESTSGDEILAFLTPRVPNLDAIVAEEAGKLKSEAVDFLGEVTKG